MILKETALLFISYILAAYLDLSASLSSTASYTPVLAPLGTAALKLPLCVSTSHSTVGLPLESKICLAVTFVISAGVIFLKYSAINASGFSARAFTVALITSSTFFDNACESMYSYHHYQKHHHHITNTQIHLQLSAQLFFCFFLSLTCTHLQSSSREERHTCTAYTLIHLPSRHVYVLLQVQLHLSVCGGGRANKYLLSLSPSHEIFFATPTTQHTHKEEVSVVYITAYLYSRHISEARMNTLTRDVHAQEAHTHTHTERDRNRTQSLCHCALHWNGPGFSSSDLLKIQQQRER